jgi:N-acetylglucosaminyldiphosphoundecaprenol N-acetyl-beta-D-mannosaminyltransferase
MADAHLVGPVRLMTGGFDECVDMVLESTSAPHIHFVNAYTIALADAHPQYADLLNQGICFTDGVPVAWVGRRGYAVSADEWARVYGPDVMEALLRRGGRHYLLGGTEATLDALCGQIALRWPRAEVVGAESPPFRALTLAERAAQSDRIRASSPEFVWVGLGTPKQDWEAARIAAATGVTTLAVGAAFDFIAGTKPQAPRWMQRSGTEWAYRLASEPRRLTRRYLWGNPRFLRAAARTPGLNSRG